MFNHAFTNYTGKPYIYYNGQHIPSNNKNLLNQHSYIPYNYVPSNKNVNSPDITKNITNKQPYITFDNSESIRNFLNTEKNKNVISPQIKRNNCSCQLSDQNNHNESWSIMARKDNMFRMYMNNSDKQAETLYL